MTATPPRGLIHLNTWSPAGSTVWEGLRGVALEEVWPCERKCVTVGVGFETLLLDAWNANPLLVAFR